MSVNELLRGSRSEGTSPKKPSLTSDWVRSLIIVPMYGSCTSSCSLVVPEGGKVSIPLPGQRACCYMPSHLPGAHPHGAESDRSAIEQVLLWGSERLVVLT